jgi:hypothetical protein
MLYGIKIIYKVMIMIFILYKHTLKVLASSKPDSPKTTKICVFAEPGRESTFASHETDPEGSTYNQTTQTCIPPAWLRHMQPTNHPIDTCIPRPG